MNIQIATVVRFKDERHFLFSQFSATAITVAGSSISFHEGFEKPSIHETKRRTRRQ